MDTFEQAAPRLSLLSDEQRAWVHARSLRIQAESGVRGDSPRGRAVLGERP